ncbi:hypothetical protein HXX76_008914 [Chlamydomonas incerta]|uniref:S-acyltransferase n=1 Tax=Chlamydomonas incerta TaxID=51695 RepID=A0A835T4Z6_CHLIN|nr:hypothetical protein HXX76_008914 [Chlamydomonas incerta]|eukprot:KAG2432570.1 hypothetical protein HXX76_008914 [Chlamydomonas incerta]
MSPPSWGQLPPSLQSTSKFLNIFQYCRFLRILGHVMVLLVLALVGLTYTAVVPFTYGPKLLSGNALVVLGSVLVILLFSAVCAMCVWSYLAAVTADPGRVPQGWHPFADEQQARAELERMAYSNYYFDRRDPRRPRFCKRCQAWKPERAHHCSVTGRCVLKMDHWCIWVVNCVGLMNYKFFLLFIFYAALGCGLAVLLLLGSIIAFFNNKLKGPTAPLVFVVSLTSFAFALSLAGFLAMHGQLLGANCTTIEMYEKDRLHPWPYNKGFRRNFEEVFGRNKWRWLLPVHTKEEKRLLLDSCLGKALGGPSVGIGIGMPPGSMSGGGGSMSHVSHMSSHGGMHGGLGGVGGLGGGAGSRGGGGGLGGLGTMGGLGSGSSSSTALLPLMSHQASGGPYLSSSSQV